jgi:hypothetical protein
MEDLPRLASGALGEILGGGGMLDEELSDSF